MNFLKVVHFTFENFNYLNSEKQTNLIETIVKSLIFDDKTLVDVTEEIAEIISKHPDFISVSGITKDNLQIIARAFKNKDYIFKKVKELENEIPENLLFFPKDSNYMIDDTSTYYFKKSKENRFLAVYKIIKKSDFKPVIPVFPAGYPDADKLNEVFAPENKGNPIDYFTLGITTLEMKLPNYRLDQLKEIAEFSRNEKQVVLCGNFNITKWQQHGSNRGGGEVEGYDDAWSFNGELEDNEDRFDRIYYKGMNLKYFQYLVEDLYFNETISSYGIETTFDI